MTGSFDNIRRFLAQAFTEKLELKLIAMIIAALLVALVRFQEETERVVEVEILPKGSSVSNQLVMMGDLPETVQLFLRGSRPRIDSLKNKGIPPLEIDLSKFQKGRTTHYFSTNSFSIPPGIELVRVIPESIQILMDSISTRTLPVNVRTVGELKIGAEMVRKPLVEPKRVAVKGPASVVRHLKSIETEDVEIEGLGTGEHVRLISARNIEGVNILDVSLFKVTMKVRWIPGQRVISGLEVAVEGTDSIVEIAPKEVSINIAGPEVELEQIDQGSIVAFVKIESEQELEPEGVKSKVKIRGLPNSVKLLSVAPEEIQVRFTEVVEAAKKKGSSKPKSR